MSAESKCPCCATDGRLNGSIVVDGKTAKACCEDCLAALFFGGKHPHPTVPEVAR